MPQFLLASAAEARPADANAATWRVVVANLLAGAVAGCAVEGGAPACGARETSLLTSCGVACPMTRGGLAAAGARSPRLVGARPRPAAFLRKPSPPLAPPLPRTPPPHT
jgi:hypothetical protein